ncbi:riboflavin biosynthesis pyrimidine reductase [Spiribacter vilamensis]|uniref:Riboflavin biosynthesis pyrimidine reductase n=2 Tax=Spiribacter vilamensis TaxID=531306 RepID=A0A4Q8CZV6_9GAMM|nr:riboflavin biosynthesis pyrimidine reductase [Spiribacter vilamensis]
MSCYPDAGTVRPLAGLYLDSALPDHGRGGPFIYANYIVSLDGRISVPGATGGQTVPGDIANARDWRLLEELAGHADVLLSSGRYLRELDAGKAQDILPVGTGDAFRDIRAFRRDQGLAPQPDVAVLSMTLDFEVPARLLEQGRRVIVITGSAPDERRVKAHEQAGVEVIALPDVEQPGGEALAARLGGLGYRRVYAITGPYVMHMLLAAGVVDALYLTTVHRIIGGRPFASLCEGDRLAEAGDFTLASLHVDPHGPNGCTQTFARYDCRPSRPPGSRPR